MIDLHDQLVLRTGLVTQMQGSQLRAGISKRAEVRCKGNTGQVFGQVCVVLFPVVGGVKNSVDIVPDIVLGDL